MVTRTHTRRHQRTDRQSEVEPRWHVVLLDDQYHTYQYVIEMLGLIFGYGPEKSYALARMVDSEGRVIVVTTSYDQALVFQGQIHAYGADPQLPQSKGSMSAVLERAE